MDSREERIVDAAIAVFSRYGVQRTTMNDIAGEAGVARQTIYNVFANKDEILRAAIRLYAARAIAAIEDECAQTEALGAQLDVAFEHLIAEPFEMMHASPHADEIVTGFRDAAKAELAIAEARYRDVLTELLTPHEKALRAAGHTPAALADVIFKSWYGFKHNADDLDQLRALQRGMKAMVLTVAGEDEKMPSGTGQAAN